MPTLTPIGRISGLVFAGLALTAVVDLPTWTVPLIVLDSPLTIHVSTPWFVAVVLATAVSAGTDGLLRLDPGMAATGFRHTAPAWVLPSLVAVVGSLLIGWFEPLSAPWISVLAATTCGVALALVGEIYSRDAASRHSRVARAGLTALTFTVALVVFSTIYNAQVRTALSGIGTSLVSFLLAVSLLRWSGQRAGRRWPYAGLIGLVVGLATWGLNHASLHSLAGGGLLLLVFYVVTGVAQELVQRDLSRRVLVEVVVALAFAVLLVIGFSE